MRYSLKIWINAKPQGQPQAAGGRSGVILPGRERGKEAPRCPLCQESVTEFFTNNLGRGRMEPACDCTMCQSCCYSCLFKWTVLNALEMGRVDPDPSSSTYPTAPHAVRRARSWVGARRGLKGLPRALIISETPTRAQSARAAPWDGHGSMQK